MKPHPILSTSFLSGYRNNPPLFFTLKSNFSFKSHGILSLSPVITSCSLSLPSAIFSLKPRSVIKFAPRLTRLLCSSVLAHQATATLNPELAALPDDLIQQGPKLVFRTTRREGAKTVFRWATRAASRDRIKGEKSQEIESISASAASRDCQSFIGVNYGQVADNLPPPSSTAKLLQSTSIQKVRLYGSDPAIIKALANTGIGIVIGAANGDIPALASDPNYAINWVSTNVVPFYPASNIILITVGNEVLTSGDHGLVTQLVPAMQNVQNALNSVSLGGKIKVSTVHAMSVLKNSEPPSSGSFDPGFGDVMKALLGFCSATGSPFAINPYPYFAYRDDPRPETLAFCLFQPNEGRFDSNTNIKYMNMFDAQVDAIKSALNSMGHGDVEIVVAETGWPYKGDDNEVGPSVQNAKAYNGNLIAHLRSMVGTPLTPGKSVDTYFFALYDENLKPGPGSERAFGLFKPDLTMTYDVGLAKSASQTPTTPTMPATPTVPTTPKTPSTVPKTPANPSAAPKPNKGVWCLPKKGVSETQLQANIDYVCGHGFDCSPIQPGGACFEPNNVASHAAYAMNILYQTAGHDAQNCDFSQTATLSSNNPSYDSCNYPSGST